MEDISKQPPAVCEVRFVLCPRCGDEIQLAIDTDPEEDINQVRQHVCTHKWKLRLIQT